MKKRVLAIVLQVCLLLSMLPYSVRAASSFNNLHVVMRASAVPSAHVGSLLTNTSQINAQTIGGVKYLFLPSAANWNALTLHFDADPGAVVVATTSKNSAATPVPVTSGSPADIGSLFAGVTIADYKYPVTLTDTATGGSVTFTIMKSELLPALHLTTDSGSLSAINANKEHKETGTLTMIDPDGSVVYDDILTSFKGRGHGSWHSAGQKKPYNIKLDKKAELIPGAGSAKNWCLISNDNTDDSLIRYYIALSLSEAMGSSASPGSVGLADVYINGEYRGLYQISEKTEVGSTRIDIVDQDDFSTEGSASGSATVAAPTVGDPAIDAGISSYRYWPTATTTNPDISGGYLFGIDFYYDEEALSGFRTAKMASTNGYPTRSGFAIESPEFATQAQVQYLAKFVQEFENALYSQTGFNAEGKYYADYIDMNSLAGYMDLFSLVTEWDHMYNNTNFYKDQATDKIMSGPAWDFDHSMGQIQSKLLFALGSGQRFWTEALIQHGDFVKAMYDVNANELAPAFKKLVGKGGASQVETFSDIVDKARISGHMNHTVWGKSSWDGFSTSLQGWLNNRYKYWEGDGVTGVWDSSFLRGCTASESGGVLSCNVVGTATGYQWYQVNPNWTTGTLLTGETNATFTPPASNPGIYYCVVSGAGNLEADYAGAPGTHSLKSNAIDCRGGYVTYDGNGNTSGTVPTDATFYGLGQTCTVQGAGGLQKSGYNFGGWNTAANGSGNAYAVGSTINVSGSVTLYAQWNAISPTITTASLPDGATNAPYSFALAATGTNPMTWTLDSGSLPAGFSLATDGTIAGTAATAVTATFTVKVSNGTAPDATKAFTLKIVPPAPPSITTASLPDGAVGFPYSETILVTSSDPVTFGIDSGALPAGLTLSASGTIAGTPTTGGTYTFAIRASNGLLPNAVKSYTIRISVPTPPAIATTALPTGAVGVAYSQTLNAASLLPVSWSLDSGLLPAGLTLSSAGVISGTPTSGGTSNFTIKASNGILPDATKALAITITTTPAASYAVVFAGGGGSGTAPTQPAMAAGGSFVLPANPFTQAGQTFAGWSDGFNTYQPGDTYTMPAQNMTFTATWSGGGNGVPGGSGGNGGGNGGGGSFSYPTPTPRPTHSSYAVAQVPGVDNSYTAKSEVSYSKFLGVSVNGTRLSSSSFTSWSGTYVRLTQAYVDALGVGNHTMTMHFTDGDATSTFAVRSAVASNGGNGNTSRGSNGLVAVAVYPFGSGRDPIQTAPVSSSIQIVADNVEEGVFEGHVIP